MIYGYIRVSSDKQTVENQRFEIDRFCTNEGLKIDGWIEETISGTKNFDKRKLGKLLRKVLAFAFGLSAEIERDLISQRTREALARKRSEGIRLGRPTGSTKAEEKYKLFPHKKKIINMLECGVPVAEIARVCKASRPTLIRYINTFIK